MKKRVILLVSLFAFLLAFAGQSLAADGSKCLIKKIGVSPGAGGTGSSGYMVQLDDTAVPEAWVGTVQFYLSTDLGDSGLATLLTAYSLGKTVWVRTLGTAPGSLISIIYMNN
ncbi:MAG: hypothetical protein C4575_11055 [Desulforudis sp.]|jgi:hypothetical protein|nr:MAG: hypothetical protein C4575_11055 [Desulforudis sp.]